MFGPLADFLEVLTGLILADWGHVTEASEIAQWFNGERTPNLQA